jgi:hypothetical protein
MSRRRHPPTDDPLRQPDLDGLRTELLRWAAPGGHWDRRRLRMLTPGQRVVLLNRETWGRYAQAWGLVSHWKLNEASGDAIDSYGSNNLTDTATVTAADGILRPGGSRSGARQFTQANSEYFTLADPATLDVSGNTDFAIACWAYFTSANTNHGSLFTKYFITGGQRQYFMGRTDGSGPKFIVSAAGTVGVEVIGLAEASLVLNQWYFILGWHDGVGDVIGCRVNNGTKVTTAHATGVFNGTAAVNIGAFENGWPGYQMDGRIDEALFFSAPPGGIADKIDDISRILYNNGRGMPRN